MATPSDEALVLTAIERLGRLTDLFERRRRQLARAVGVTEQQWRVLDEISTEHFIPSMFARAAESSPAAVSKIIRQLVDRELVSVSISQEDARQRDYELTAKGKALMARLREQRQHAIEAIWSDLDGEELQRFERFSAALIERIERYAQQEE